MSDLNHEAKPWRLEGDRVRVFVRLTPKAAREEIGSVLKTEGCAVILARVRALPDKGVANRAVIKLIAKWISVPKSSIELVSGERSRHKTLKIIGNYEEIFKRSNPW